MVLCMSERYVFIRSCEPDVLNICEILLDVKKPVRFVTVLEVLPVNDPRINRSALGSSDSHKLASVVVLALINFTVGHDCAHEPCAGHFDHNATVESDFCAG
jgi:hypothetical protein